jgi:hypothetical protein
LSFTFNIQTILVVETTLWIATNHQLALPLEFERWVFAVLLEQKVGVWEVKAYQLVAVLVVLASAVAMVVVVVVADKVAVELASVVVPAVGMVFVERLDLPLMSEVYIADVEEYLAEP